MTDRREFLKLFGVGASIIPIVGSVPIFEAESKIVEAPKVELYDKLTIENPRIFTGPMGLEVIMMNPSNGTKIRLQAKVMVTTFSTEVQNVRTGLRSDFVRAQYVKNKSAKWTISGDFISDAEVGIMQLIQESI